MKARHLLPLAALALPLCMQAKPAYPGVLRHVNADGTTVQFRLHGDEHFSYITDTEGMLMDYDKAGNLQYQLENGLKVSVTPEIVENLYMAELDSQDANGPMKAPSKMAALDGTGRTTYPTIGENHSLVILIEYSDVKFKTGHPEMIERMLNEKGYKEFGSEGSARDYYEFNSLGQYKPIFDVSRVVTLPKKSSYYVGGNKYLNFKEAIKYAIDELDGEIDFSNYDNDNDGIIDTIYFFYAGYGQADTGLTTTIWPHQSTVLYNGWVKDGKKVGPYACSNELNGQGHYYSGDNYLDGPGTFIHEFGHVLGMPDLYDVTYSRSTVTPGEYSVMDNGSYLNEGYCPPNLSGYEKWLYKWIEYTPVEANHYTLKTPNDGGEVLRIPVIRKSGTEYVNEYFVLESRNRSNWDTYLADDGLLIWHVNYSGSAWSSNNVNVEPGRPRMYLVSADGTANPFLGTTGSPKKAMFPGTGVNNTFITPETEISLNLFTKNVDSATGTSYITGISYDGDNKVSKFDYNLVTEAPDIVTTMREPYRYKTDNGLPGAGFELNWDPVEGTNPDVPVEYLLTVYRINKQGNPVYEDGYEEKSVGSDTHIEFKGFTTTKMNFEYHAYVRVLQGIPAAEHSNEITFKPSDLNVSGVEGIAAVDENAPIYGVKGGIVAPAGAEIYNISGVRVKSSGLAAGVYVVRAGSRTVKVVVK